MKKTLSLILAVILSFACFATIISAAADGFSFKLKAINAAHTGDDNVIFTTQKAYTDANSVWAISIHLRYLEGTLFEVVENAFTGDGTNLPAITLATGDIVLSVHSATSDVAQEATYPNVKAKLAAKEIKKGMFISFSGITLEQALKGTVPENAAAVCSATKPGVPVTPKKIVKFNNFDNVTSFVAGADIVDKGVEPKGDFCIDSYDDNSGKIQGGLMQIVDKKGIDGSKALGISKTGKVTGTNDNLWSLLYSKPTDISGTSYLVVWVDFTGVDFRKACFGVVGDAADSNILYRTDEADVKEIYDCPFFIQKDGKWLELKHGGDGCFGTAQDTPVLDYKGYIAVPLNTFYPWVGAKTEPFNPNTTKISALFFYFDYTDADKAKEFYFDDIKFVSDYKDMDETVVPDVSEPVSSKPESSKPESSKPTPETSDSGLVAFAIISALTVAGAVIIKKSR